MWYKYRVIEVNNVFHTPYNRPTVRQLYDRGISTRMLRWWLEYYPEQTEEMVRTIKPYQQLVIHKTQIASISSRMMRLFWGKPNPYIEFPQASNEDIGTGY